MLLTLRSPAKPRGGGAWSRRSWAPDPQSITPSPPTPASPPRLRVPMGLITGSEAGQSGTGFCSPASPRPDLLHLGLTESVHCLVRELEGTVIFHGSREKGSQPARVGPSQEQPERESPQARAEDLVNPRDGLRLPAGSGRVSVLLCLPVSKAQHPLDGK